MGRFLLVSLTWLNIIQTNAMPSVVLTLYPLDPTHLNRFLRMSGEQSICSTFLA